MKVAGKSVQEVKPKTRRDLLSIFLKSITQQLESLVELSDLAEIVCEDVVEPWLDVYLI